MLIAEPHPDKYDPYHTKLPLRGLERKEVCMAAEGSVPPTVGIREDVHVTGRRILATLVDGLVFGVLYTVLTALFGTFTVDSEHLAV